MYGYFIDLNMQSMLYSLRTLGFPRAVPYQNNEGGSISDTLVTA
jgi:hypothetical protein